MPLTDTRDLQRLAVLRQDLDEGKRTLALTTLAVLGTPEGLDQEAAKLNLAEIRQRILETEFFVRDTACEHWSEAGDTEPWPGVKVKMYTVVEYDRREAEQWAKVNAPYMLLLNHSAFEKAAKVGLAGLVAKIVKEPRATIARDLSQYLPKPGEPEPEEDDREDIPI